MRYEDNAALVLYDDTCGFCAGIVGLLRRLDGRGRLQLVGKSTPEGRAALSPYPELSHIDSVVWIGPPSGGAARRVAVRSDAVLLSLVSLGGVWSLAGAARIIPRFLRDAVYGVVARNRHWLRRKDAFCEI